MRSSGARQSPRARAFRLGRQSFRFSSTLVLRDMAGRLPDIRRACKTCCISTDTVHSPADPAPPVVSRPSVGPDVRSGGTLRGPAAEEPALAKIHYEADGAIAPDRFIAALTDFSSRRTEVWPNLSPEYFKVHALGDTWADVQEGTAVLGGVWARERYDWSEPGRVTLTLIESPSFRPGTLIDYRVTPRVGGGCHVSVDFQRIATSLNGRVVGVLVQLAGRRQFARDLRTTLHRLAAAEAQPDQAGGRS